MPRGAPTLASEIVEHIFTYLDESALCAAFATCRHWYASRDSRATLKPVWHELYRRLVDVSVVPSSSSSASAAAAAAAAAALPPPPDDFDWRQKVVDLHGFLTSQPSGDGLWPVAVTECDVYVSSSSLRGEASARLVSRSGHSASRFFHDGEVCAARWPALEVPFAPHVHPC